MENPLERGTVGNNGNTLVTNYAWLDVEFDGFKVSNIPLKGSEYDATTSWEMDGVEYNDRDVKEHAMHMSGYNCYIKSFSCTRAIPNAVETFWTDAGGSLECNLVIFDPSFVQFENMIMQSVKNQKVHCKISYGISAVNSGTTPKPFEAHCFIKSMSENVSASGTEWTLTLNTVPPETFDKYPEKGSSHTKETVFNLGKGTEYKRVSDLVAKILEEEGWNGIVIETEELKKSFKIPTKDFSSRIDLVRLKLAPMAKCSDDQKKELYHIIISLDNSVYFMPSGMTIKEALESKIAKKIGTFDIQDEMELEINDKSTIEQLNMNEYITSDEGALVFKYGFQNSIVQSLSIDYDCMSMITQFFYDFTWNDDSGTSHGFRFPDFDDDLMKDKDKQVFNKKIFLYETNEEDAKEMAKTIVRKLQIVNYKGSATLINWPYVSPMQEIRFEYLIPNGSAMAMKQSNEVGKKDTVNDFNKNAEEAKRAGTPDQYAEAQKHNKSNENRSDNKDSVANKKTENQILAQTTLKEEKIKSLRSKGLLKGNAVNSELNKDADYRTNVGIPASLTSWSDTHKQSTTYLVKSIKDTIEGGIMLTELELTGLFNDDFPQLNASL